MMPNSNISSYEMYQKLMYRFITIFFVFILAACSATNEPARNTTNDDLLPLAVGNEWVYARTKFVRGSEAERDTVTLKVVTKLAENEFILVRSSQYSVDSLHVRRHSPTRFDVFVMGAGEPLIDHNTTDPFAGMLIATTGIVANMTVYQPLPDTVYSSHPSPRVREHVELMDNSGEVLLRLDFDHVFVPGIGQVAVRFVADINECLQCSLISEFWVSELMSYTVQ